MRDCYEVLNVRRDASPLEIRRAYRKKAKLLHPDITGKSSDAFRELREAYEILSDAASRALFDEKTFFSRMYRGHRVAKAFDYREWLIERDDDESLAKLIFFDLMHGREDDAVREFKLMNTSRPGFSLSRHFTREDFMDYGYILAEELVLRREYYDAVLLLDQLIHMEFSYAHYRLFFPEVQDLARHVLRNNIESSVGVELALDSWERALDLRLGAADDAFFLLKISGCYERMGDKREAEAYRERAAQIEIPAGADAKKVHRRAG